MSELSTTSWSEVAASNNQANPNGWPDGMNANGVEPTARELMAAVKRFWTRINPTYLAVLATTDSYTVTPTQALDAYHLREGWHVRFPSANTATSPTINISSLGGIVIRKYVQPGTIANLAVGDIQAQNHRLWWDGTRFILDNPASLNVQSITIAGSGNVTTNGGAVIKSGTGSPNGSVLGNTGDLWLRTDGTSGATMYVCSTSNTWTAVSGV